MFLPPLLVLFNVELLVALARLALALRRIEIAVETVLAVLLAVLGEGIFLILVVIFRRRYFFGAVGLEALGRRLLLVLFFFFLITKLAFAWLGWGLAHFNVIYYLLKVD